MKHAEVSCADSGSEPGHENHGSADEPMQHPPWLLDWKSELHPEFALENSVGPLACSIPHSTPCVSSLVTDLVGDPERFAGLETQPYLHTPHPVEILASFHLGYASGNCDSRTNYEFKWADRIAT